MQGDDKGNACFEWSGREHLWRKNRAYWERLNQFLPDHLIYGRLCAKHFVYIWDRGRIRVSPWGIYLGKLNGRSKFFTFPKVKNLRSYLVCGWVYIGPFLLVVAMWLPLANELLMDELGAEAWHRWTQSCVFRSAAWSKLLKSFPLCPDPRRNIHGANLHPTLDSPWTAGLHYAKAQLPSRVPLRLANLFLTWSGVGK